MGGRLPGEEGLTAVGTTSPWGKAVALQAPALPRAPHDWTLRSHLLRPGKASTVPSEASHRADQRSGRGASQGWGGCHVVTSHVAQEPLQEALTTRHKQVHAALEEPQGTGVTLPFPEGEVSTAAHTSWKPAGHLRGAPTAPTSELGLHQSWGFSQRLK